MPIILRAREPFMWRFCIIALLLCSQLTAPALSGQFVCFAANGCICVDDGAETCTCCIPPKRVVACNCGCNQQESEPSTQVEEGGDDCAHIAIGDCETPVRRAQASLDIVAQEFVLAPMVCVPAPTISSLARNPSISHHSATLALIATVVLRI